MTTGSYAFIRARSSSASRGDQARIGSDFVRRDGRTARAALNMQLTQLARGAQQAAEERVRLPEGAGRRSDRDCFVRASCLRNPGPSILIRCWRLTPIADRARTRLRAAYVSGLIGHLTFENRLETALRLSRRDQLSALLIDLPTSRGAVRDAVLSAFGRGAVSAVTEIRLPSWNDPPLTVGRSRSCDVHVGDDGVSARHAELRALDHTSRWLLVDLGSTKGTWFLGRRVGRTVIEAGDSAQLGEHAVTFVAPR